MKPTYSLPPINGKRAPEVYDSRKARLAAEYVEKIGYDPFVDDPSLTVEEVTQTLKEYDVEAARMVAKMARDAYRDHLADMAILERQALARLMQR
jgi:RNase H-fold protein (predicted Holliday junction resolvase)